MAAKIKIEGLDRSHKRMLDWLNKEVKGATQVFRGYAAEHLALLIRNSPQESGDFAANWNYSLNVPDTSFEEGRVPPPLGDKPYEQLSPQAIGIGLWHNLGKDASIKLGDTVYFTNRATHEDQRGVKDAYYQRILNGTMNLRDANMKVNFLASIQEFKTKYPRILKGNQMGALKRKFAGSALS